MDISGWDVLVVVGKAALLALLVIMSSDDPGGAAAPHQGQCSTTCRWCDSSQSLANLPAVRS